MKKEKIQDEITKLHRAWLDCKNSDRRVWLENLIIDQKKKLIKYNKE